MLTASVILQFICIVIVEAFIHNSISTKNILSSQVLIPLTPLPHSLLSHAFRCLSHCLTHSTPFLTPCLHSPALRSSYSVILTHPTQSCVSLFILFCHSLPQLPTSLTPFLTHSLTHLPHSLIHSLPCLSHSLCHSFSLAHFSAAHFLTQSRLCIILSHSLHYLTHSLTHSPVSLTLLHSLPHLLPCLTPVAHSYTPCLTLSLTFPTSLIPASLYSFPHSLITSAIPLLYDWLRIQGSGFRFSLPVRWRCAPVHVPMTASGGMGFVPMTRIACIILCVVWAALFPGRWDCLSRFQSRWSQTMRWIYQYVCWMLQTIMNIEHSVRYVFADDNEHRNIMLWYMLKMIVSTEHTSDICCSQYRNWVNICVLYVSDDNAIVKEEQETKPTAKVAPDVLEAYYYAQYAGNTDILGYLPRGTINLIADTHLKLKSIRVSLGCKCSTIMQELP